MQPAMHLLGKLTVMDAQSGQIIEERDNAGVLLPPKPGHCQLCATHHEPADPHNRDSLYYQLVFQQEHKRPPTWADAIVHCALDVQQAWRWHLRKLGVSEEVLGMNPAQN